MLSKLKDLMSALEIFANHLSRLSFDNSRVLSPWCSITFGSLKNDLLSLPCLFEQLTIAQKAGMIISVYQSIKIHSGKTFVYTSGLLVCLPIWRTINWWRHTRTLYWLSEAIKSLVAVFKLSKLFYLILSRRRKWTFGQTISSSN